MSYDSNFHIEGINREIADFIGSLTNYQPYPHGISGEYRVSDTSWYEHESDLRTVSERYPTRLITVTIYGEEDGDIKRKYFRNGQMQSVTPTITWPECTLPKPHVFNTKVALKVLGEVITIEVEHIGIKSEAELHEMAKSILRNAI